MQTAVIRQDGMRQVIGKQVGVAEITIQCRVTYAALTQFIEIASGIAEMRLGLVPGLTQMYSFLKLCLGALQDFAVRQSREKRRGQEKQGEQRTAGGRERLRSIPADGRWPFAFYSEDEPNGGIL